MPNTNKLRGAFASAIFVVSVFFVSSCQENVAVPIADEAKQDLTKSSVALTAQQKQQIEEVHAIIGNYMKPLVEKIREPKDNNLDISGLASFVNSELAKQKKPLVKFFTAQPRQNGKDKSASLTSGISVYADYESYGYKTKFAVGYDMNDHALFNYGFASVSWYADYWYCIFVTSLSRRTVHLGYAPINFAISYNPVPGSIGQENAVSMTAFAYDTDGNLWAGGTELIWYGVPAFW